ncbi:AfsR/SARP family transcriptional regulator [Actinoallomurus spadix]|uniref:AfsR/SARP family transcriptional regulator n=1 Tax=Actinoallomurus spadix TaxID=79912 RepID=UPI0027E387A7|nr:tetratricopeptide repeat protein [Actinoallomurus spadix]
MLGPIEFWLTGIRMDLGTAKERLLLAVLLLAEGRPVSVETLIDRVWGQDPPAEVRQSLQTDLSRLRRRFKKYGVADNVRLAATPGAYALEVAPEHVDVFRSRLLHEQAISRRQSGTIRDAIELLREAVSLWRAEPLTGISGEWVEQMRASLDGDYRVMIRELIDMELAAGNHAKIVGLLVNLIARYPLDEYLVGQLMIAYYRCGRQADAIGLYHATARRLREDAGAAPSPRLQALFRNIRRHDPAIAAPQRAASEPVPGLDRFPPPVPEFTGRAEELAALATRADAADDVVLIEGMPSVGKTALAVKAAHDLAEHFPDGCFFLPLHGHDADHLPESPAAALSELLQLAGLAPTNIPRETAARAGLWRDTMEGRRALLVLDDALNEDQVRPLLPGTSDCRVIITSRRHLAGIDGHHRRLGVLPTADAVALFTRIAEPGAAAAPDAVTGAVRLCGGLPLAIRLAATRWRDRQVSSLETLAEDLRGPHENIAGLQDPALAATFALSYRDLSIAQRRIFRRLGFSPVAEVTPAAVAVLAGIPVHEAERTLADFADHYLIEETAAGRFQLHDLIRQYAMALPAREDPEFDVRRAVGRMLDHYLLTADMADRMLFPHHVRAGVAGTDRGVPVQPFPDEESAASWLAAERKNLVRLAQYAADHAWNTHAIDYAKTVARYFDYVSQWEEAERMHRRALNVALEVELPRAVARARLDLAVVQWRLGRMDEALANATKAEQVAHRAGDAALRAAALDQIGLVAWSSSKYREALAYFGESLDLYRDADQPRGKAECLNHLGMMQAQVGRHQEALCSFRDALESFQSIGDIRGEATTLSNLAHTHLLLGYHRDAYELFQRSRAIYRTLTGRRNKAILNNNLGDVARYRGRHETALKYYNEALAEFSATGDRINESNVLNNMGLALTGMEQYDEALTRHRSAVAVARTINNTSEKIRGMLGIADVRVCMGQYPIAVRDYRAARRLAQQIGDPHLEAQSLSGLAHVTSLTKGHDAARIYWRQAYDLFLQLNIVPEIEAVKVRLDLIDLADH